MHEWLARGSTRGTGWVPILTEPAPLREVIVSGNGKDADLTISLADGRRFEMGAADVTVSADGPVTVRFKRIDDVNAEIRYSGADLEVRSARISFGPDGTDEFRDDVSEWLESSPHANPYRDSLGYCVDAEIVLAPARM